ncbi:MAG: amidohydrolase [Chloroflexi bacterium]|nr:amidohydrolase [Chloroflexota bacterium]
MIIDSHCHAWTTWPYQPPVPDPQSRGRAEQLLFEMDQNGVDQALLVCAQIDHNAENNAYVAEVCRRYPDRLHLIADVDSMWSETYHQPGAAQRLLTIAERWPLCGFTHYIGNEDDGAWLVSEQGLAFFGVAAEQGLLASISCHPHHQPAIRGIAERYPNLPILIHHLGHPKVGEPAGLNQILKSAAYANIHVKISGFYYASAAPKWDYPILDVHPTVQAIYDAFGPAHMCWGSDYPVVRQFMTYKQALECFRTHCNFIPPEDQSLILGGTLNILLS